MSNYIKSFLFFLSISFVISECYCQKGKSESGDDIKSFFSNKIIGFSSFSDSFPDKYNFNDFYLIYHDDEILLSDKPVGYKYEYDNIDEVMRDSSIDNLTRSAILYHKENFETFSRFKFIKSGNAIYLQYQINDSIIKMKQYSLNSGEKTNVINIMRLCEENSSQRNGTALFMGKKDTSFSFLGKRFNCLIFQETYIQGGYQAPNIRRTVYLEEKTLLPVKIIETLVFYSTKKVPQSQTFQMNFILNDSLLIKKKVTTNCD